MTPEARPPAVRDAGGSLHRPCYWKGREEPRLPVRAARTPRRRPVFYKAQPPHTAPIEAWPVAN